MVNGGIAGVNFGNISNCKNKGSIDAEYETGGIVGAQYGSGKISNCVNEREFIENFGAYNKGGILGTNSKNGIVEYCYNLSDIDFKEDSGHMGIIGTNNNNGIIQYCFNKGNLNQLGYVIGGIAGTNLATIQNSYWLGTNLDDAKCKEAEFMKTQAFVDLLNSEDDKIFCMDVTELNNGYPILSWQKEIQTENNG